MYDFEPPGMKLVYRSTSPKDIAEFNAALNVSTPEGEPACACIPSPVIRLYRGKAELVSIEVFGTYAVHTPLRRGDLSINDAEKWLGWFDARKMPRLRKEYEDELARNKQSDEDYARWLAAMPGSIRPLWDKVDLNEMHPDIKPLQAALSKEFPDVKLRARALFKWYGSGAGPWSGYPAYEDIAESLLLTIPTQELISVALSDPLSEEQVEGAARLFGGWEFSVKRPDDGKLLPEKLKAKLLAHSLKSTDQDKLGRARYAFSPAPAHKP